MKPVTVLFDTGAYPNLIYTWFIPWNWANRIKRVRDPRLKGAKSDKLNLTEVILLQIHIGWLRVRAWFGVFENFAVKVLLGTLFIDLFVKFILWEEQMVVPKHSKPVAIMETYTDKGSRVDGTKRYEKWDERPRPLLLVAKKVVRKHT